MRADLKLNVLTATNAFSDEVANASLFTAVDVTDGAAVSFTRDDDKTLFLIQNGAASAKAVTFKAGNGIQGTSDLVHSVPANSTVAVTIDSGFFKNVTGTDKGKVVIAGESTDIKIAVFALA
jgi:hypothetical protein